MRVRLLLQLAALLLSLSVQTATASHVAVPADFASIQGAIDSHADTVLVAPGEYAEDLAVGQGVVLLSAPPPNCELNPPMPQVGRLTVTPLPYSGYSSNTVTVQQFEFRGQVVLPSQVSTPQLYVSFHSCEMDSGIAQGGYGPSDCAVAILIVDSCSVKGSSSLASATVEFTSNVVEGGGVSIFTEGELSATNNRIHGPAPYGLNVWTQGFGPIYNNTVSGTSDGMLIGFNCWARGNRVSDCSGRGIVKLPDGIDLSNNVVERCGGFGIDVPPGNTCAGSIGGNVVLNCGGGIRLRLTEYGIACPVAANIIGHCAGPGIDAGDGWTISGNTLYGNQGPGIIVGYCNVTNNIAYNNGGFGLVWNGSGWPTLGCNDWYGNASGETSGLSPDPSDLSVNPFFCDVLHDNVHLSKVSSLVSAAGCGLIGALGVGCAQLVSVIDPGSIAELTLRITPNPSFGRVTFTIAGTRDATSLEIYDISGARRWRARSPGGEGLLVWDGKDDAGRALSAGVYFARIISGRVTCTTPVILMR